MKFQVISDLKDFMPFKGDIICIPIQQDPLKHRKLNQISFIYIYNILEKKEYIINVSHYDYPITQNLHLLKTKTESAVYAYNRGYIRNIFPNSIEINVLHWNRFGSTLEIQYTEEIATYHRWYSNHIPNINNIVPLMCWMIYCRNIRAQCTSLINEVPVDFSCIFYNTLSDNLIQIENSGISIDPELSKKYINKSVTSLYCQYNLYTSTGRPSNHFNSINFAALNKKTGIRNMIIPKNANGYLIEWDYDSAHVRLLANLINFKLPKGNLHQYLGRLYFKTPIIDDLAYIKSKNLTWQLIYGNIHYKYLHIPFVKSIYDYRQELWSKFKSDGYITLPISKRKIRKEHFTEPPTANLIFNYLMQGYETEYNSLMLVDIFKYLYKKKSRLILYTYDSFLFDYDPEDGTQFLNDISNILESKGMETTIKYGKNYHNMKKRI